MDYAKESLRLHGEWKGKIEVVTRVPVENKDDLSLAYTPGVAQPCLEIQKDVDKSYDLTRRWNMCLVVTDGSAVLGLGNIGPEAGMPVMEGKCVLFKAFGDVDAFPLCIKSNDVDEIVNTIYLISGSFGGVNLEDISAPRCFEIEKKLKEKCDKTILHDISLYAKPGQKLAFVGSTGAGKTTITNLINRFYNIQKGKIRYDGINITKIKKDDLRHSLGIVLQDTHLFTGTIRDNIRYGKLDATDEEIYAAAKLAHADQFIQMLPKGYDTMLSGDGEELSQGQRQLLSIARAAVADPPVLILDEATSSIDTRTESIVQKGMDNLMKGRTVFVIAHRLSTIRNSDAIIVLEHGKIIERGDHKDLIRQKGTYYQLYTGKLELS